MTEENNKKYKYRYIIIFATLLALIAALFSVASGCEGRAESSGGTTAGGGDAAHTAASSATTYNSVTANSVTAANNANDSNGEGEHPSDDAGGTPAYPGGAVDDAGEMSAYLGGAITNEGADADTSGSLDGAAVDVEPIYLPDSLPGDVYSFAAELNGVIYSLPAPYYVFMEQGWAAGKIDLTDRVIGGGKYEFIEMANGGNVVYMGFINNTEEDMALSDCFVGLLHFGEAEAASGARLVLPCGVTIGSSYDEIIEAYGQESKRSDFNWGIVSLQYNEYDSGLELELDADTMCVTNINYKNFSRRAKLPEYEGAPPAGISDYKPPNSLGTDWRDMVCAFGGDLYSLPVPAAELLKNGWVFLSDENTMLEAGGRSGTIELRRSNQVLYTTAFNPDEAAQPLKYCYITELSYDRHNTKVSLELPGSVNERSTILEIADVYGEPVYADDSGSMFAYYEYGTDDYGIRITWSLESAYIVFIGLHANARAVE